MNEDSTVQWDNTADSFTEPSSVAETERTWTIEDFTLSAMKVDQFCESPEFFTPGFTWSLRLYPHGESQHGSEEWIGLYLTMCGKGFKSATVDYIVGIQNINGTTEFRKGLSKITFWTKESKGWIKFLKRGDIMCRKSEFYPLNALTISISLTHDIPEDFNSEKWSKRVGNVRLKDDWKRNSDLKALTLLSDDLRKMFMDGEDTDVTIKVKGEIIKAHKAILKARSEVFSSMLTYDTLEKKSNKIKIDDCEPEAFKVFLLYLYTGKVEKITDSNIYDIFCIADKYCISDLRAECVSYMICSMSVHTICSVISVAKKHSELELMECATDYFNKNVQEIVRTKEWRLFSKHNRELANELHPKVLKKQKKCNGKTRERL